MILPFSERPGRQILYVEAQLFPQACPVRGAKTTHLNPSGGNTLPYDVYISINAVLFFSVTAFQNRCFHNYHTECLIDNIHKQMLL